MKYLFTILLLFQCAFLLAQSPELTIDFTVRDTSPDNNNPVYYITFERCELSVDLNKQRDWFSHDTSTYYWKEFRNNKNRDFKCADADSTKEMTNNVVFNFSNQIYAFENVMVFTVHKKTSEAETKMIFYFPVKISSFVTFINLGEISFREGVFDLNDAVKYDFTKNMYISISLYKDLNWENYRTK